jgi:hypothetical protein
LSEKGLELLLVAQVAPHRGPAYSRFFGHGGEADVLQGLGLGELTGSGENAILGGHEKYTDEYS